jgi:hypothetical protein
MTTVLQVNGRQHERPTESNDNNLATQQPPLVVTKRPKGYAFEVPDRLPEPAPCERRQPIGGRWQHLCKSYHAMRLQLQLRPNCARGCRERDGDAFLGTNAGESQHAAEEPHHSSKERSNPRDPRFGSQEGVSGTKRCRTSDRQARVVPTGNRGEDGQRAATTWLATADRGGSRGEGARTRETFTATPAMAWGVVKLGETGRYREASDPGLEKMDSTLEGVDPMTGKAQKDDAHLRCDLEEETTVGSRSPATRSPRRGRAVETSKGAATWPPPCRKSHRRLLRRGATDARAAPNTGEACGCAYRCPFVLQPDNPPKAHFLARPDTPFYGPKMARHDSSGRVWARIGPGYFGPTWHEMGPWLGRPCSPWADKTRHGGT